VLGCGRGLLSLILGRKAHLRTWVLWSKWAENRYKNASLTAEFGALAWPA
jgi:hypothetical protein